MDAWRSCKRNTPHLILMDLSLHDMSGWEAVEQLRRFPEFADIPIIAVTAHASSADRERAIAVGCTVHLGKLFDANILLRSITRLLQKQ